jgi:transcriptional regulator with XRE-family HTH domain
MPAQRQAKAVAAAFGIELRAARLKAHLTQQKLAEGAEIDPVFVSFLENGRRQPSLAVLLSLEHCLGLNPGELSLRAARRLALADEPRSRAKRGTKA